MSKRTRWGRAAIIALGLLTGAGIARLVRADVIISSGTLGPILGGTGGSGSGGAGTPGGSTTQIQFNDAGAFSGDDHFIWDKSGNTLTIGGAAGTADSITLGSVIIFEGATADAFETTITPVDPTADRAVSLPDMAGTLQLEGSFVTPTQIVANTNDYSGCTVTTTKTCRLSTDASRNITGITGGASGVVFNACNVGAQNIVFVTASASSTAANRFLLGANLTLGAEQCVKFIYDSTASRWRHAEPPPSAGSGSVTSVTADTQEFVVTNPTTTAVIARAVVYAAGNITGATTINWNNGLCQNATMTGNVTFTFSNPLNGGHHCLILTQDGTGSRTATWPGSVQWPGGTAPVLNSAASAKTRIDLVYDGTAYTGIIPGNGGLTASWSNLSDPSGNLALNMAGTQTEFAWTNLISGVSAMTFKDSAANVGVGPVVDIQTVAGSSAMPLQVTALGTANGVQMTNGGVLGGIGTGEIRASLRYCADAGSTDTYACNLATVPTAYATGNTYSFKANTANTGAATINFNSLGAKTIVKVEGGITTALADNDIRSGQYVIVTYDGTNMQMQSTKGNAGSGAPTSSSYVTLGTDATLTSERVLTGTANQVVLTDNGAGSTLVLSTPQDIGTASAVTFGGITINAGTGSGTVKGGGLLDVQTGSVQCAVGSDGTLFTYTIPANTLSSTGAMLDILAIGVKAANGNSVVLKMKFGSTTVWTRTTTGTGPIEKVILPIIRTGASTQSIFPTDMIGATGAAGTVANWTAVAATETDTSTITLLFTANCATNATDFLGQAMITRMSNK